MVTFTACRNKPELVVPARATPRELRSLSDIDNQPELRLYATVIEFFGCLVPGGAPAQPASYLKAGLAEALVHYHPIAGRLRELPGGKRLVVDCTAEGVVFVEAHANVRLEEFGKPLVPPYPCVDQLMCDVGDADVGVIVGKPLLYLQMTQLRCGGLVLALTMCHSLADAFGMVQILRCILDLARGEAHPAVLPLWERHLLVSSSSPEATPMAVALAPDDHSESETQTSTPAPPFDDEAVTRSFHFGPREIAALRSSVPARLGRSSTVFELITAAMWRCRAAALEHASHERVRVSFVSNARGSWKRDPPLPPGFYGNALFGTMAEAAAGELCMGPLARAVELVHEAKLRVTDDHVRSVLDLIARGDYHLDPALDRTFMVSDITRCGDDSLNLGSWAERVGGGAPSAGNIFARLASVFMSCKDANGDDCVVVPICLPELAMGRFASGIAAVTSVPARSSM